MKILTLIFLLMATTNTLFSQSIEEKTYKEVIKSWGSTAPDLVVIKIRNVSTGEIKEVCTDMTSLFWAIWHETNLLDDKVMNQTLLSHSSNRTFDFKKPELLERLGFNTYHLYHEAEIINIIKKNHLIDSLSKINKLRDINHDTYYEYRDTSSDIVDAIEDSIKEKRPLTIEEAKIIHDLNDRYNAYYEKPNYIQINNISKQGKQLIAIWRKKILPFETAYFNATKELNRVTYKFADYYIKKYGLNFCHIAFRYGATFYYGDPDPPIGFGRIVK